VLERCSRPSSGPIAPGPVPGPQPAPGGVLPASAPCKGPQLKLSADGGDAGAGNRIGDTIEELGAIWKGLKTKKRFGFCLDTCHMFVSGIDLRTPEDISQLLAKFDKLIGLDHLEFIHLNDAMFDLGSRKDRHANIGKGKIGLEGFEKLATFAKENNIDMICETAYPGVVEDIKILKEMRDK